MSILGEIRRDKDNIVCLSNDEVKRIYAEFEVDMDEWINYDAQYSSFENDNYKIISEYDSFGGEGKGEERWNITKIINKQTGKISFIKFDGYYESWNGTDWEEWYCTVPSEVVKISW